MARFGKYMSKAVLTIWIESQTRDPLNAIATETHRWQLNHIRRGLREAEAGRFVAPAQMTKLVNRLRSK